MNFARIKLPNVFLNKSKKEIRELIERYSFNEDYSTMAIDYYCKEMCLIDIAMEYGIDRRTAKKVIDKVVKEIENV